MCTLNILALQPCPLSEEHQIPFSILLTAYATRKNGVQAVPPHVVILKIIRSQTTIKSLGCIILNTKLCHAVHH